jgi:aspartate/methionine/tyrosine aminotransferase
VALAGGVPVAVPTDESTGFRASIDVLEAARTPRTKALVFVSPSNPTGAVYPPEEVEAVGRWAAAHDVWVIADEIYEHLVYGDARFSSVPGAVEDIRDRFVIVNGVAKTFAMTGWRVGWMVAPPDVVKAATNLQSHQTSNVSNVAQAAVVAALEAGLDDFHQMHAAFDRRRQTMYKLLSDAPGVTCFEPQGAFYCFPSFAGALGRPIRGRTATTSLELCELILEEAKVAVVPGEAFGAPGYARLSYALDDESLVEGVTRIAALLSE